MIDRAALLTDLQGLLRTIEADLLERSDSAEVPEVGQWLRSEYANAKEAERTGQTQKEWTDDFIAQVAAAWVLSCVFARFLEDNELVDPPRIAGPGKRLERARDEHTLFFQDSERAKLTDREYLLDVFCRLAKLPAAKDVFGLHNPMNALPQWLGPDVAGELLKFFQRIDANTGDLLHDFTDPEWDTRFLGDLYQDLSEVTRKKYALLQTPEFVEEFILDRTLEPALNEFGLDAPPVVDQRGQPITESGFRMIDPACGSGHFLLGSFSRILEYWQKREPATKVRELTQRALNAVHGVDVNPYAIAVARFRLLLAAMKSCDIMRLAENPRFTVNLACGDSLLHAPLRGGQQVFDWELTSEERECDHAYMSEDLPKLKKILRPGIYHAVVANPPYIVPNDATLNARYRSRFSTCYRAYSLAVPFMERVFGLATAEAFTGQITSNSFMKRIYGKKLVEEFFPKVDLTRVVDTSLAYIPGHGTPTVILFGRNRAPTQPTIRTVMGIRREPHTPEVPEQGQVWQAIIRQVDDVGSESDFISVADSSRALFHKHPWSVAGGGAAELKQTLDYEARAVLGDIVEEIGYGSVTREDDAYLVGRSVATRKGIDKKYVRTFVEGDKVRDWRFLDPIDAIWPYNCDTMATEQSDGVCKFLWRWRTQLSSRVAYGLSQLERGNTWFEYSMFFRERFRVPCSVSYAEIGQSNHFVFNDRPYVFKETAPLIIVSDADRAHGIVGVLNSSLAFFWMSQVFQAKGGSGVNQGVYEEGWERYFALSATGLKKFPIPENLPSQPAIQLQLLSQQLTENLPSAVVRVDPLTREGLNIAERKAEEFRGRMIALQEELDWHCYRLYGLLDDDFTIAEPPPIELGQRACEIVMARKMANGELETTWFDRHGSTPVVNIPDDWPEDYRQLVERRIKRIDADRAIGLIERPEYKRRWRTQRWGTQLDRALVEWLLDRLESHFDFDGRMNDEGKSTSQIDLGLISIARLADIALNDAIFLEVGSIYRDDTAFNVPNLVAELVAAESVPILPVLRYKPSGLRKRRQWEVTWELQREVDAGERVGDIPLPPRYKSSDIVSSGGARYWALRGKLDVPKERWISFPHCEGEDGTLMLCWAGYDHLQQARSISAHFVDVQERFGGRNDPRLVPLLGCLIELLPWLKQWHNEVDPEFGMAMGDYFEGFVNEEARNLGKTIDEIKAWTPPKRSAARKKKASKKS